MRLLGNTFILAQLFFIGTGLTHMLVALVVTIITGVIS